MSDFEPAEANWLHKEIKLKFETDNNPEPADIIDFERVIRMDICSGEDDNQYNFTIKRFEVDFRKFHDEIAHSQRVYLARIMYKILRECKVGLDKIAEMDLTGILQCLATTLDDNTLSILESTLQKGPLSINLGEDRRSENEDLDSLWPPYSSSLDIQFTGKTAVIVRSNVMHLRFKPCPLVFTNCNDEFYYRNIASEHRFRQCTFINAWDKQRASSPLRRASPMNQRHDIDLAMVLCVLSDGETGKRKWLMTETRFSPIFSNISPEIAGEDDHKDGTIPPIIMPLGPPTNHSLPPGFDDSSTNEDNDDTSEKKGREPKSKKKSAKYN